MQQPIGRLEGEVEHFVHFRLSVLAVVVVGCPAVSMVGCALPGGVTLFICEGSLRINASESYLVLPVLALAPRKLYKDRTIEHDSAGVTIALCNPQTPSFTLSFAISPCCLAPQSLARGPSSNTHEYNSEDLFRSLPPLSVLVVQNRSSASI